MFSLFTDNKIRPEGWLKKQLRIQADGLSGNLDKIWPDVRDSAWIGGNREGWERVPYWLDGFLPLAYLLEDDDLISRAEAYVSAILDRQEEDGWICPCKKEDRASYDLWAALLIGKVLSLHYELTGSRRSLEGLYRAMKKMYEDLNSGALHLFFWGKARWFEGIIPLLTLKKEYNEEWIPALGALLRAQGSDYPSFAPLWEKPMNKWTYETHIVNLGMMFKYEALTSLLLGEPYESKAEQLWNILDKTNGTAVSIFTGDECLSGLRNNQGTELCAVAELMYSCEWLWQATGNPIWADRLEKVSFNALPATISDDMWTHQYDQQVNQIACVRQPGKPIFRTNNSEANLFGLEPNFGCCTANFNQAWPKLAMNVFHETEDGGIVSSLMLPATLKTEIKGLPVTVSQKTDYPFEFSVEYTVSVKQKTEFPLWIRLPGFAKSVKLNGKPVKYTSLLLLGKEWEGKTTFTLTFSDRPHLVSRPFGMNVAEYGPLVFALPLKTDYKKLEFTRDNVERKFPYCDYELTSKDEWRYGFASAGFEVKKHKGDKYPFSSVHPRLTLVASLSRVDWDFEDGYDCVSAVKPNSRKALSAPETKELYPYGCAKLRITEMVKTVK